MKNILITGASSGFGYEAAKIFVQEGYFVLACARRKEKLDKLKTELGENCYVFCLDVTNKEDVDNKISELYKKFNHIDVLINNAGLALGLEPAHLTELDDWFKMIDVNIKGLVHVTRQVVSHMVERNIGHIINIGSIAGTCPYPGGNVYGGTKAFVGQFTRNLKVDLFGTAVRVTNIAPGSAETEFSDVRFKGDVDRARTVYEGRASLQGKDIAETILWCVSRPEYVNINSIEIMAVSESVAGLKVDKKT